MKRNTRSGLVWLLALSLFISVTASTIALASRIEYYTAVADVESMIPLVPEYVTEDDLQNAAQAKQNGRNLSAAVNRLPAKTMERTVAPINVTYCAPVLLSNSTDFTVSDDNTVWGTNTRVDIFKTEYEDGQHNITVASSNGDRIIAPGTENSYTFKLKNEYGLRFDYTVTVKAYCTPDNIEIPVVCRLSRYDGKWIAGDDTTWQTVPDFDGATDTATLSSYSYVTYTLDWKWPFEGDDALDTALTQLVTQEDATLTIEIITTAEVVETSGPEEPVVPTPDDPDPMVPVPGEPDPMVPMPEEPDVGEPLPPKTGDESNPALWIVLAAVSFVLMMILLFWKDKDEKNTDAEANKREETDNYSRC